MFSLRHNTGLCGVWTGQISKSSKQRTEATESVALSISQELIVLTVNNTEQTNDRMFVG